MVANRLPFVSASRERSFELGGELLHEVWNLEGLKSEW